MRANESAVGSVACVTLPVSFPQQCLCFLPLPQGQGAFLLILLMTRLSHRPWLTVIFMVMQLSRQLSHDVAVAVQDEAGKIDINFAPKELIASLLSQQGMGEQLSRCGRD